jgi:hypothetical protein
MKVLIGQQWMQTIDAQGISYKATTADPVPTAQVKVIDNASSIQVNYLDELLILDDQVTSDPAWNLLLNPSLNPIITNWTYTPVSGVSLTQFSPLQENFSLYLANAHAADLSTADQLYSALGSPAVTQTFTQVGGPGVLGWGEIYAQGSTATWPALTAPGGISGHGWLFDTNAVQGCLWSAGAYGAILTLAAGKSGGTLLNSLGANLLLRFFRYNVNTGAALLLEQTLLNNQTLGNALAGYTFPTMQTLTGVQFDIGDMLYVDFWAQITSNTNGNVMGIYIGNLSTDTSGRTGSSGAALTIPGYFQPAQLSIVVSNAPGTGESIILSQTTWQDSVIPGMTYTFSFYMFGNTTPSNVTAFFDFEWLDASQNFLTGFGTPFTPINQGVTRNSLTYTAPAGAAYIKINIAIFATSGTNSASYQLWSLQLEPQWFAPQMSYPSPFCGPSMPGCQQLPPTGQWIRQYRKFAGFVQHWTQGNYHGNVRTITIDAVGYAWLMGQTNTAMTFTNTTDATIITTLLSTYFGSLFDTSKVVGNTSISALQPAWDDLRQIFDGLCADTGNFWTVDAYWHVLYQPPGYTSMPIALIADNSVAIDNISTFPIYNFQAEMDGSQPGASILVIGASQDSTTTTASLTKGTTYTSIPVNALPAALPASTNGNPTVLILGTTQLVTVSATANAGATSISVNSFTANSNYGIGTQVTWAGVVTLTIDPARQAFIQSHLYGHGSIGSLGMRKIMDIAVQSLTDANTRGLAELLIYDKERYIYHGSVNVELLCGQSIQLTSATEGLSATSLLIQQVQVKWLGTTEQKLDLWEYTVDLGSVNRAASALMAHIFRRTTRGMNAPGITQTQLVAVEPITLADVAQLPYPLTILQDGPTAYYRLNEPAGTMAFDASGNQYNATWYGTITPKQPGAIANDLNCAYLFDGSSAYLSLPAGVNIGGQSAISLECWFQVPNPGVISTYPRLVASDNTGATKKGVDLYIMTSGGGLTCLLGNGNTVLSLIGYQLLQANTWYHVVVAWSASGGAALYLNGVQLASGSLSGTLGNSAGATALGYNPVTGGNFFAGTLDEPAIYLGTQLTAGRVATHYRVGITGRA